LRILAVQAKAITLAVPELWDGGPWDGDVPETRERVFIEAVCAFVGVEVPSRTAGRGGATQCRIPGSKGARQRREKTLSFFIYAGRLLPFCERVFCER
jgi:hypothetical protein